MQDEELLTTSDVARALRVAPSTIRRYLSEGYLPEPGWTRLGRRHQRAYSLEWLKEAARALGLSEEEARAATAQIQNLPPAYAIDSGIEPPRYLGPVLKLSVTADLGPADFATVAAFLAGIDGLYTICYFAASWRANATFIIEGSDRLRVAALTMASPLHAVGAARASAEAAKAAHASAELLETAATLGSKRKSAKAAAAVAAETVSARVALENAQARRAIAEAETAELDNVQRRITILSQLAALAAEVGDPEILDSVRLAAREMLGPSATHRAIGQAASVALSVTSQAHELEVSADEVP